MNCIIGKVLLCRLVQGKVTKTELRKEKPDFFFKVIDIGDDKTIIGNIAEYFEVAENLLGMEEKLDEEKLEYFKYDRVHIGNLNGYFDNVSHVYVTFDGIIKYELIETIPAIDNDLLFVFKNCGKLRTTVK